MPSSYAYHLTFELYPTPDPSAPIPAGVWRPGPGASLFDDLAAQQQQQQQQRQQQLDDHPARGHDESGDIADRRRVPPTNPAAQRDWRFGRVQIACFDMEHNGEDVPQETQEGIQGTTDEPEPERAPAAALGPVLGGAGHATRARYNPLVTAEKTVDAGWGVVHLYREGGGGGGGGPRKDKGVDGGADYEVDSTDGSDGTVLCIPAVPSYLTPRDFLGFVGEAWSRDIRHYRMVLTSRTNRYLVLLKFRSAARARAWRAAFDGRVFNSMEAEVCHVAYIQSISIAAGGADAAAATTASSSSRGPPARPFPPPTPSLIEMPTCPVCLERMDDTAGLMTILCQHVFHCTCLQTWKGSGCPVCRATNPSLIQAAAAGEGGSSSTSHDAAATTATGANPYAQPFGAGTVSNLCAVCDCADDLWICLICGNVGCGRYKGGHAKDHWKESGHSFSLELETQHVWDYAGDMWVHRLLRDKGDGKVVELPGRPGRRRPRRGGGQQPRRRGRGQDEEGEQAGHGDRGEDADDDDDAEEGDDYEDDVVPRAKLEGIGMEYTHLLTSQLESQRVYFEELVAKAADKAGTAAAAAEAAAARAEAAAAGLAEEQAARRVLAEETVPGLERDAERERRRADKAAALARTLGQALQEEKKVSEGLLARVRHVQEQVAAVEAQLAAARAEGAELRETNRDLSMFISGQAKLQELEAAGAVEAGEVAGGTARVAGEEEGGVKGKGKGKGGRRR